MSDEERQPLNPELKRYDADPAKPEPGPKVTLWKKIKRRTKYYLPVLQWLPKYECSMIFGDAIGGMTTGVMVIAQSIAYTRLTHTPPVHGLYTAFFPLLFYFFFGTSRHISIGPDAVLSLLFGTFTLQIQTRHQDVPLLDIGYVLTFMVGAIALGLGILRLGFIDSVLSRGIISGLVLAVASTIILNQIPGLLGYPDCATTHNCPPNDTGLMQLVFTVVQFTRLSPISAIVGVASLIYLWVLIWLKETYEKRVQILRYLPPFIVLVITLIIISWKCNLGARGVKVFGLHPGGFIAPRMPLNWDVASDALIPAATIALLMSTQSIVITKSYAAKYNYPASSNREMVALGMMNFLASFFGAFPACGSFSRTKVNDMAGVKSLMFAVFASTMVLVTILWLLPYFAPLPSGVMSAIVITAMKNLIKDPIEDLHHFILLKAWSEIGLFAAMALLTFLIGVQKSIFIAICCCLIILMNKVMRPTLRVMGRDTEDEKIKDLHWHPTSHPIPGVALVQLEGPLHFANVSRLKDFLWRVGRFGSIFNHPSDKATMGESLRFMVFDFRTVPSLDATALLTLKGIVKGYHEQKIKVLMVIADHQAEILERAEITTALENPAKGKVFTHFTEALNYATENMTSSGLSSKATPRRLQGGSISESDSDDPHYHHMRGSYPPDHGELR